MNLHYDIAWIEDQPDSVVNFAREISDGVRKIGFRPMIKYFQTPAEINALVNDHKKSSRFDLFLVDWNLMEGTHGDEIIDALRNDGLFTDVVFYSSAGIDELRKVVSSKGLEGVFIADRKSEFANRTLGVIKSTVKKVVDVENMRGIAASCVADIDYKLSESIFVLHQSLTEARQNLLEKKLNDDLNQQKTNQMSGLSKKIAALSFAEIVRDSRYCGSADLVRNFKSLHHEFCEKAEFNDGISKLIPELDLLLQLRNQLAHQKFGASEGKITITRGQKETYYSLDGDGFRDIRVLFVSTIEKLERIVS